MKIRGAVGLVMCLQAAAQGESAAGPVTAPAGAAGAPMGTAGTPTGTPIIRPSAIGGLLPTDFSGDLRHRPALSGDWEDERNALRRKGISFDFDVTQIVQGNLAGGAQFGWPYHGSANYIMYVNTGKAGLWPGGFFKVHGETQFGESNNRDTGSFLFTNTNGLYPAPEQDITTLSEIAYAQFFVPEFGIILGKFQPRDANVFAHDEKEQFLNSAFVFNPVIGATMPLDFLTIGTLISPTEQLTIKTLVIDSEGTASRAGFDTAFRRGTLVYNEFELAVAPFGLPGHQRLMGTYSDEDRPIIGSGRRLAMFPFMGAPEVASSDWCVLYDFDQYVYTADDHSGRGWGVFGRFGYSDGRVNPIEQFYSIGIAGRGMVPGRPDDTFGIGYYFVNTSRRFHNPLLGDEQGGELYYNIHVTPWLRITPDLQIISPARQQIDTTVVFGLRVQMKF